MIWRLLINYESLATSLDLFPSLYNFINPYFKSTFCQVARLPFLSMEHLTTVLRVCWWNPCLDSSPSSSLSVEIPPILFYLAIGHLVFYYTNHNNTSSQCTNILQHDRVKDIEAIREREREMYYIHRTKEWPHFSSEEVQAKHLKVLKEKKEHTVNIHRKQRKTPIVWFFETVSFVVVLFLFLFFKTGFLCSFGACPGTSSCRHDWPRIHRNPPTSASWVLGLKVCATTAQWGSVILCGPPGLEFTEPLSQTLKC